jgi:hypothetical protein
MADVAIANKPMEGGGYYNRNSNLQAAGVELALPLRIPNPRRTPE